MFDIHDLHADEDGCFYALLMGITTESVQVNVAAWTANNKNYEERKASDELRPYRRAKLRILQEAGSCDKCISIGYFCGISCFSGR